MPKVFTIGICDDNEAVFAVMQTHIDAYAKKHGLVCEVICFLSGEELLLSIKEMKLDLLFLDIDMPGMDGIQVAAKLNEWKRSFKIVMLTNKTERFKDAFKIGAFRFVTKPIQMQEVFEAMESVWSRRLGEQTVQVFRDGKSFELSQKDICYMMAMKDYAVVYTQKYEFRSDKSLNKWEEVLDSRLFVRCHKAFIVNVSKIDRLEKDIILYTGERVEVSRRKRTELEKALMIYDTKYR